MRKNILGACVAVLLMMVTMVGGSLASAVALQASPAASPASCPTTTSDQNVAIVKRYLAAVTAGDTTTMASILSPSVTYNLSIHGATVPNDATTNADEIQEFVREQQAHGMIGNPQLEDIFAGGDRVAIRFSFGLNSNQIKGAVPGRTVPMEVVAIMQIKCGLIQQVWLETDTTAVLGELGVLQIVPATPTP